MLDTQLKFQDIALLGAVSGQIGQFWLQDQPGFHDFSRVGQPSEASSMAVQGSLTKVRTIADLSPDQTFIRHLIQDTPHLIARYLQRFSEHSFWRYAAFARFAQITQICANNAEVRRLRLRNTRLLVL